MHREIEISRIIEFCQKVQGESDAPKPTITLDQINRAFGRQIHRQPFVCDDEDPECYCE